MELMERAAFLATLHAQFEQVAEGEGHSVFISGEAGIGKTSLVKAFTTAHKNDCLLYQGTCDALFTPRPLAPLYDIGWQMQSDFWENSEDRTDRVRLFARFFHAFSHQHKPIVIVFEDVHWADEATLDFIKFLARRITQLQCLFILTYRDHEIHARHPLSHVLGQLNPGTFSRIQLPPLSRQAVDAWAEERGYKGEDVYSISGGNPFYVNEILASYSPGIPDNIRDSILHGYNEADEKTRQIWQILSVLPTALEVVCLEKIEPEYASAIENCLQKKILLVDKGLVFFKHELYRRTVEASLSPLLRVALNKKVLTLFREHFEQHHQIEQLIHHAKNANEYELVVQYAPLAARQAASMGAHIEAARLYLSAIEYYQGNEADRLIGLYEAYAYECYLTNQVKEAIIYTGRSLALWKEKKDAVQAGNCMRFLSRLWWFEGNRRQAETFAEQAVEALAEESDSREKAMAYSNMSQLKMLSDQSDECIHWGEKAIALAQALKDEEIEAHALNSVGSALMTTEGAMARGIALLQQSLEIALRNAFHEHVARAYTALGSNGVTMKDYAFARHALEEGILYCEDMDLDSLKYYMVGWKARLNFETGNWQEAYEETDKLLKDDNLLPVIKIGALSIAGTIRARQGRPDALPLLLEAKTMAFKTIELQRIIPALSALLEYEWLTGNTCIDTAALDQTINMIGQLEKISKKNKFYYWLRKARRQYLPPKERYEGYDATSVKQAILEAAFWEKTGCPYEQALALYEGTDDDKRTAIAMVQRLGAQAVYEKLKQDMRTSGIKSIPRGIRKTTQSNPALLTGRELEVLQLLKEGMQNKEIAQKLYISPKTVDHHISAILFKLDARSRALAVQEAVQMGIVK